ncbi:hypothetical protein BJ741DRAFT_582319 [Chytriomyces cf. hyalinus JEL632]|nr:hypothetical protein BJ741DRAFT_582319 [Chytriomyces cf. hyalinus JEL632]
MPFSTGFSLNAVLILLIISFWKIGTDQDRTILYSVEAILFFISMVWNLVVVLKDKRAKKGAESALLGQQFVFDEMGRDWACSHAGICLAEQSNGNSALRRVLRDDSRSTFTPLSPLHTPHKMPPLEPLTYILPGTSFTDPFMAGFGCNGQWEDCTIA